MDDMFETDFSFLSGLQVEIVPDTEPVTKSVASAKQRKTYQVAGLTYQVQGSWFGVKRGPISPETSAKISAVQTGRPLTAEWRANISAALKGHTRTAETRAKMSAAQIGKTHTAEARAKMSAAHTGKSMPANAIAKISKPVMTPFGEFPSQSMASRVLGLNVAYLMKKGTAGYYYIKDAK